MTTFFEDLFGVSPGSRPGLSNLGYLAQQDDFQAWAAGKPPEAGIQGYFDMVEERTRAERLEF